MLRRLLTRKSTLSPKEILSNKSQVEAAKNDLDKLLATFSSDNDMKRVSSSLREVAVATHESTNTIKPESNFPVLMEFKRK